MKAIQVKVLSYRTPQQYAVQRTVRAAAAILQEVSPGVEIQIQDIRAVPEILSYTQVLSYPSLVINEKLVCVGLFPKIEQVVGWLKDALHLAEEQD